MANYQFKPLDRVQTNKMHPVDPFRQVMPKRSLGESGITVGEIGLGTMPLGRLGISVIPDDEANFLIQSSLDQEACLIDTAPTYGDGRAETLVGQAITGRRHQAVVVTKAGYFADGHADFSGAAIRESLEGSLKRLKTSFVDVLLLHNPGLDVLTAASPAFVELEKLKKEGKLRAYGAAVVGSAAVKAVAEKTSSQVVEAPFNIFNQEASAAFAALTAKRVGFIASSPLDSGFLSGRYSVISLFTDERTRFSRPEIMRREALARQIEFMAPAGVNMTQAALQFILSHSAVSTAVVGSSTWQQVINNVTAPSRRMPEADVKRLQAFWDKELKAAPLSL